MIQDRAAEDREVRVEEGGLRPARHDDGLLAIGKGETQRIFHYMRGGRSSGDRVAHLQDAATREAPAYLVALELLHVPRAMDLEMRAELEDALVRDHEGSPLDRQEGTRTLVGLQMLREQPKSVRISFRSSGETQELDVIESRRVPHEGRAPVLFP